MTKRLAAFLAVIVLLSCAVAGRADSRKLLIAVMDKVSWHDVEAAETPTLARLARQGHIALMVTRTAGGPEGAGSHLTIGAGSRAAALPGDRLPLPEGYAFDASELVAGIPAGRAYKVQTGWPLEGAAIVHLGIGPLLQQNFEPSYPLRLGLLGEMLRRSGRRVACVGNADTEEQRFRPAVAIGMDERGRVPGGDVGRGLLRRDLSVPYGYTTDPARLGDAVARAATEADVLIVDLGETSRAAACADLLPPERVDRLRLQAAAQADRLLATVLRRLGSREWAVLVVTPSAPPPGQDQSLAPLTPVITTMFPGGPGLLVSPSTRRPGLVANTDVAATVLSYFGIKAPADSVGRPMAAVAVRGDPRQGLDRALARHDALEVARRQVFRAFATFATAALWLGAFALFIGRVAPPWGRAVARGVLLSALAAPLAALMVGALPVALSSTLLVASVVCATPLLALLAGAVTRWQRGDAALAAATTVLLGVDLLTGQHLLEWAPLSYSASAGARFYGIGNEYAGAMLGAALVAAAASASPTRSRRIALTLALLAVVVLVGWPRVGANFGMALAGVIGLGLLCLYLWRQRLSWRDVLIIGAGVVALAGGVVAADLLGRGGASHIALLIGTIRGEGWTALSDVIVRKVSMNWLLMRASQWTGVAAAALGAFAIAAVARPAGVVRAAARWRWLVPASAACLAGAVASFLLNDSGIVAAAILLCYGAGSLAYVGLGDGLAAREEPDAEAASAAR